MRLLRYFWSLILFLSSIDNIKCDYFSSIAGLEKLVSLEDYYLDCLKVHIREVEKFNKEIDGFLNEVELEQVKFQNDTNHFFENPINAFKTVKRFVVDWKQIADLVKRIHQLSTFSEISTLSAGVVTVPTISDLEGASRGISRLQHIYKLQAEDIADGYLGDKKYNAQLTSEDCFHLGRSLYNSRQYLHASEWLIQAIHKLKDEDDYGRDINVDEGITDDSPQEEQIRNLYSYVTKIEILQLLGPALHRAGNHRLAVTMNKELLELDPNNKYGLQNKLVFEDGVRQQRRLRIIPNSSTDMATDIGRLYTQVCSGTLEQIPAVKRNLHCRYVSNNVPFYFLSPLKMEELNFDPFVAYYHQVISANESRQIIEAATNSLERSAVGDKNETRIVEQRISKSTWLSFGEYGFLGKISQRLQDITGLSIESGESLQVANYGIGGHYAPHLDASSVPDITYPGRGNRILTALIYINQVEMGGATAFPYLHLAVPPIKGSLLVWYNLHKSGKRDHRTIHAGCPVIKGSKWICNEWFHSVGQEFRRPCGLEPDDKISKPYQYFD